MLIVVPTVTLFSYDHGTRYVELGGWVAGWLYKAGKAWSLPISLANIASCGCKRCHGQILAAVSREGMSHSRTLIVMFHICICRLYVPHKYFKSRSKNSHNLDSDLGSYCIPVYSWWLWTWKHKHDLLQYNLVFYIPQESYQIYRSPFFDNGWHKIDFHSRPL